MRHATILVAILAFVPLTGATAQVQQPLVERGARVRVTRPPICRVDTICGGRPPRQSVGTFLAWKADSLVVQSNGDTVQVALMNVTRLDLHMGRKAQAYKGAVVGGLVVVVPLAILFALAASSDDFLPSAGEAARGLLVWGAAGAFVGALIGSAVKTDRWEEVPLDRLRVSLGPQRDGRFALGASVKF